MADTNNIVADLVLNTRILLRRAEFEDNCVLAEGEPGYHTGTKVLKIGDGSTIWKDLPFANQSEVEDLIKVVTDQLQAQEGYATDEELRLVKEELERTKLDANGWESWKSEAGSGWSYNGENDSTTNYANLSDKHLVFQKTIDNEVYEVADTTLDASGLTIFYENKDPHFSEYAETKYTTDKIIHKVAPDTGGIGDDQEHEVYTLTLPHATDTLAVQADVDAKLDANNWTSTNGQLKYSETLQVDGDSDHKINASFGKNGISITEDYELEYEGSGFTRGHHVNISTSGFSVLDRESDAYADLSISDPAIGPALNLNHTTGGISTTIGAKSITIDSNWGEFESYTVNLPEKAGTIALDADVTEAKEAVTNLANNAVAGNTAAISAINNETTGILAKAKAYSDTQDVFHTDILTVNALGGVAAGANLDGLTVREVLNTLLYPYVAFVINSSSRNAAAATLENGATQTLSSCSISVTKKSKPITSIKLFNGSTLLQEKTGADVANGGTITFNGFNAITVSKSNNPNLKFTVTDGQTSTDRNVGASSFVYPYYWGKCAKGATINEALIEGLGTKKVQGKTNSQSVTDNYSNECMVFAYPAAHGKLVSILDPNNFETLSDYLAEDGNPRTVSITGLDGTAQSYYVYVSSAGTASNFKATYKLVK